jgi:hypothetical protein
MKLRLSPGPPSAPRFPPPARDEIARGRFKLPEASLGVFVTGGLTATLAAFAGLSRAKAPFRYSCAAPRQSLTWGSMVVDCMT